MIAFQAAWVNGVGYCRWRREVTLSNCDKLEMGNWNQNTIREKQAGLIYCSFQGRVKKNKKWIASFWRRLCDTVFAKSTVQAAWFSLSLTFSKQDSLSVNWTNILHYSYWNLSCAGWSVWSLSPSHLLSGERSCFSEAPLVFRMWQTPTHKHNNLDLIMSEWHLITHT